MAYSQKLRELFPDITLQAEDLLLLETFQIKYLPDRVAKKEFALLLRKYPVVHRFLINKHPSIESFLSELLEENAPLNNPDQFEEYCQEALWEIADLIIYNKHPDLFDSLGRIHWNIEEITAITPLEGRIVADVGAGSGRIAFLVTPYAQTVFAVEPIARLRTFMKEKADKQGIKNLHVMDGTLDSIPLPADSLDLLITSNAIGWNLSEELKEIERVVKHGGSAIHLLYTEPQQENPYHEVLTSAPWFYGDIQKLSESTLKIIYHKTMDTSAT
jgi:ubiquinone/menaquinone biosynthesis C-methylase UbiE